MMIQILLAYTVDIDFCLELEPVTHIQIQKHFNDSIADTSIPFVIMITIIVILLML